MFLYLTKKSLLAYEIYHFGTMNIRCSKHIDIDIGGLSGKYPAILNISGTGRVDFMQLDSQSEDTLLCIREQSLSRGASQSAVRRR